MNHEAHWCRISSTSFFDHGRFEAFRFATGETGGAKPADKPIDRPTWSFSLGAALRVGPLRLP